MSGASVTDSKLVYARQGVMKTDPYMSKETYVHVKRDIHINQQCRLQTRNGSWLVTLIKNREMYISKET